MPNAAICACSNVSAARSSKSSSSFGFDDGKPASILDGINRKSIIQIARDLGFEVVERDLARAELYLADEVFVSGTAAELTPLREIDDHAIGDGRPGEITRAVQAAFEDALHGRSERYREWLDPVPVQSAAPQVA